MRYLRPWRAGGRAARAHRYLCVIDPDRLDPDHLPRELAVSALTMAGQDAQQFHNGVTGNALKPLCSKAVVDARDESGDRSHHRRCRAAVARCTGLQPE